MKNTFRLLFIAFFIPLSSESEPIVIKLAGVAPEGSVFMDVAHEFEASVEEKTGKKVDVRWYSGGVLGDEPDMIRLMKLGQLHGAGITGLGAGTIDVRLRVLEVPLLLRSYNDVDKVTENVFPHLQKIAGEKGFLLLEPSEAGFVYLFSKKPVRDIRDLEGMRLWVWAQDFIAISIASKLPGIIPVQIPFTDVPIAVSSGLIEAFYAIPLIVIALQVHTKVKYMIDIPIVYGSGWFVVKKDWFLSLPPDVREIFKKEANIYFKIMKKRVREENEKALSALVERGLIKIKPDPILVSNIEKIMRSVRDDLKRVQGLEEVLKLVER